MKRITWRRMVDLPEVNLAIFSFLLNFGWEMGQVPFFKGLPDLPHWAGIKACTCAGPTSAIRPSISLIFGVSPT